MPPSGHRPAACPYCRGADVARMYLGSVHLDSCQCAECGARWDEDPRTGEFRGRGARASVVTRDEAHSP